MRKLSLEHVYGCSTIHRHSIIGLPDNRLAFLAGSYLVILDCSTNEQRYLSFSAIEYVYITSSSLYMGIIDRFNQDGDARIHIYSTKPIGLLFSIEPDRFGNFLALTMNHTDNLIMILHDAPAYMITIQEIQFEEINDEHRYQMNDLASVRVVHGSIVNRMTKKEIHPRVEFLSFSPFSSQLICVTGFALFKLYEIDHQNLHEQTIHFRPEFYGFTCHCWLDRNSILIATDHGHVFWIQDGSIRSDINLQEFISMDLNVPRASVSNEHSIVSENDRIKMLKDDLFASSTTVNTDTSTLINEFPSDISSEESIVSLDLLISNEIHPYFIVSFQEYLLIFKPIDDEPFFHLINRYCLRKTIEQRIDPEIHHIHKMSYIFDQQSSLIYLLTNRNQIFRYKLLQSNSIIKFEEKHIYGYHAFNILSIGLCEHKSWLITLGSDHWLRILDYEDHHREILSKYISEDVYAVTSSDPYGFHLCLSMSNHIHLYLITNSEFRLLHQYETRNIRAIDLSPSGHLLAVITTNLIKIYSTITMNLISQLRGHVGKIQQISWCKSDSIIISCGTDGMIYTFNVYTGMRENEIITKQFHYLGLAVTNDCHTIYAITSDSNIKIFSDYHLETEWTIENQFLPSAICLSKSERLLYIGMTHGIIRIYTLPLTIENYTDISAHSSTIRRLLISSNDQYLISIAESAYILLFKQTTNVISSISNQYQFSQISKENLSEEKFLDNKFQYILITKTEFEEQKKTIEDIQLRINEFQTENNLKLHSKEILFSKHINTYSNRFQQTIKDLIQTYEQLKNQFANQQQNVLNRTNDIENQYQSIANHAEIIYEKQMIETLSRIEIMQNEFDKLSNQSIDSTEQMNFPEIIKQMNLVLQSKWKSSLDNYDQIQDNHRHLNEYIKQIEVDIDEEIQLIKTNYENQLKLSNDYINQLTNSVSTLRKQYNSIINRIESRDQKRIQMENEVKELENRQIDLNEKLDHFRFVIKKKEDRIGLHDMKIHRLQQHILHVEKRKYVLDYKTKSLLEYIEPIDQEIVKLKENNLNLEQDLTKLKQQQNNLIAKQFDYEKQIDNRLKEYHQMIIQHRSIWKIVKQQKDLIKKAFEYIEIHCTSDLDNLHHHHPRDQLKSFLQHICQTLQNESQIENEDFLHEWNQQQKWLNNQLHHLTKYTEKSKENFSNAEREHRKAIAPFINQLRDLHYLSDEIEKKIQKHLSFLKIKSNEKNEFLETISQILHQTEQYHHLIDQLKQFEQQIDIQDQQIQLLSSNIFRSQYSNPCSEY